jgi:hypothetical protein
MTLARLSAAAAVIVALSSPAAAQTTPAQTPAAPITKLSQQKATVTITAIDAATRTLTLKNDKGEEDRFQVGPEIKRFDELKVGDKVNVTYYESLVFQVRKPGEPSSPTGTAAALSSVKNALPTGIAATQTTMTVTVKTVDPAVPSITVTTAEGHTFTRKIGDKKYLENVKPGDRIDITYTEAVVMAVERVK